MLLAALLFVGFVCVTTALVKRANRSSKTGRRSAGARKPSWILRAWNASGAPQTSETTLGGAAAIVAGKAAGAASRGGWRATRKAGAAGRWFAARTLIPFDKWLERKRSGLETAADLAGATPLPDDADSEYDVVHDADPRCEPDNRTADDFTSEELLFTPRGRLALKEHELQEMTAAFQSLKDAGDVDAEVEAEHLASRRRIESDIAALRRMVGPSSQSENPVPQPRQEHNPMTIGSLYDAGDAVAAQKFEGIIAVERFLKAIADGTDSVTSVWTRWAERLAGPLHVDESIVSHIRSCTGRQTQIAELTGEGATYVTELLNGSTQQALENNREVPHHRLMDSGGASPAVPEFYDRFRTSIVRPHEDIRGEVLLMAAVKDASDRQSAMFQSTAQRLEDSSDMNLRSAAAKYYAAAKVQRAISAEVEEAHVRFVALLQMTLRDLTNSSLKAPNANMVGVN